MFTRRWSCYFLKSTARAHQFHRRRRGYRVKRHGGQRGLLEYLQVFHHRYGGCDGHSDEKTQDPKSVLKTKNNKLAIVLRKKRRLYAKFFQSLNDTAETARQFGKRILVVFNTFLTRVSISSIFHSFWPRFELVLIHGSFWLCLFFCFYRKSKMR